MSCIARTFGAPESVPAGKMLRSASRASRPGLQARLDVAHQMENVAVALDLHVLGHGDRPGPSHATEVVAAQVDEHHVLRPLLRISLQGVGQGVVLCQAWRLGAACPAIGCVVMRSPSTRTSSSGLAPTTENSGIRTKNRYGLGLMRRSDRYNETASSRLAADDGPLEGLAAGDDDLDRLARGDGVLGRPNGRLVLTAIQADFDLPKAERRRLRSSGLASPGPAPSELSGGGAIAVPSPFVSGAIPARLRRVRPASSASVGRPVRSRASKMARSAMAYRPSMSGASVWSEATAESVWVRWSKTRTRSVSWKAAIGTPIGSFAGSGTVGSNVEAAS